ncbi:hypothetical protein N9C31_01530, partial [Gammaproteobacteria bacterium]|nr:hypothetical protein [Gammaproteobacteria bacterium]
MSNANIGNASGERKSSQRTIDTFQDKLLESVADNADLKSFFDSLINEKTFSTDNSTHNETITQLKNASDILSSVSSPSTLSDPLLAENTTRVILKAQEVFSNSNDLSASQAADIINTIVKEVTQTFVGSDAALQAQQIELSAKILAGAPSSSNLKNMISTKQSTQGDNFEQNFDESFDDQLTESSTTEPTSQNDPSGSNKDDTTANDSVQQTLMTADETITNLSQDSRAPETILIQPTEEVLIEQEANNEEQVNSLPRATFSQMYNLSIEYSMGLMGQYFYKEDTLESNLATFGTDQLNTTSFTFDHLLQILHQADHVTTFKFVSTLPQSTHEDLNAIFGNISGKTEDSIGSLRDYINGTDEEFELAIVDFFIKSGFMTAHILEDGSYDLAKAKLATLSDISAQDIRDFLNQFATESPAFFLSGFLLETNPNEVLDDTDPYYTLLSETLMPGQDITYLAEELAFSMVYGPEKFNMDHENLNIEVDTLTTEQMQLILNNYLTHLISSDALIQSEATLNNQLFFDYFIRQVISDPYTTSLENHMNKLGQYFFAIDPLKTNDPELVDTWIELGDYLNNEALTETSPILTHFNQLAYLSLKNPNTLYQQDIVYDDFTSTYQNNLFINLQSLVNNEQYLTGYNNAAHIKTNPIGGITYAEGLEFINSIWNDNQFSKQELLLSLKLSENERMLEIYDAIQESAGLQDQSSAEDTKLIELTKDAFYAHQSLLYLGAQEVAGYPGGQGYFTISHLDPFFVNESDTDAYITLYINHLEEKLLNQTKLDNSSLDDSIIPILRGLLNKENADESTIKSDLNQGFDHAMTDHLGVYGNYLYMSDTLEQVQENIESEQFSTGKFNYENLIYILENADAYQTDLFLKTASAAMKANILTYFSETDSNGLNILDAFSQHQVESISQYQSGNFDENLIDLLKASGLINPLMSTAEAKQDTFGDISRKDLSHMVQDIIDTSPHELIWTFLRSDNDLDDVFNENNPLYSLITHSMGAEIQGPLTWTELAHMAVYEPAIFDKYFNDHSFNNIIIKNINEIPTSDLQIYLSTFTDFLESANTYEQTDHAFNSSLLLSLLDQDVQDMYAISLNNQLGKLNGYLFLVDPTANDVTQTITVNDTDVVVDTIDTQGSLANALHDTDNSRTIEAQHYENNLLLDIMIFDDTNSISSLFSPDDAIYSQLKLTSDIHSTEFSSLFIDTLPSDYDLNRVVTLNDYTDIEKSGLLSLEDTPFGGITYYEGREFIDSIWNQTSGFGVQEMLIILEENNTEGELAGLYDQITIALGLNSIDAKAHLLSDDPQTYKAYIENLEAYTPIDTLRDFFDTESLTDAYMGLFIDHMQTQYRILVDDPAATSQVIADLHTAISKDNIPFDQLYHEALDFSMGLLGQYYYIADSVEDSTSNETGQLSTTLMTYQYLVNLLNNADANTTELFIKTLPADVISNIESHFSAGIISDYHSDSLNNLASYIDSDSSMESAIIGLFQEAGFIDPSLDQSAALDLTFGDITDSDMQTFLQNILAQNSGELIGSFLGEITNTNISETGRFNTDNDYYQILTDLFPSLNVDDLVYQLQAFDFDDFNEIDGLYNSDGTSAADVSNLSTHQLQLILDHYITQRFGNDNSDVHSNISLENQLMFELMIQKTVLDPYKASLDNHLSKLGDFLFAPESITNNLENSIDTWKELGDHLDNLTNPELAHYDSLAYLLLRDPAYIHQVDLVYANLSSDYDLNTFTKFQDYLTTDLTGFDQSNHANTFGGITHNEGLAFINQVWQSTGGAQDLLIALYQHDSSGDLSGIYSSIVTSLISDTPITQEGFSSTLLTSDHDTFIGYLENNSLLVSGINLTEHFSTETQSDAYISLFIDRLEDMVKQGADTTDVSGTLIPHLRHLITKDNAIDAQDTSDFRSAYEQAIDAQLRSIGKYIYTSDDVEESTETTGTDQFSTGQFTYQNLIDLLSNASSQTTEIFLKTLPFNIIDNIHNLDSEGNDILVTDHFSKLNADHNIYQDFTAGTLLPISHYVADNTTLGEQLINMFKDAGLIESNTSFDEATALTFGDVTRTDLENMIQDIATYSPHELMWSLIRDNNLDNVFDANDHFYSLLTTDLGTGISGGLTWTELAHMAVYNPVLFDRYYTDNSIGDTLLSNSEVMSVALLQEYLDAFNDFIESNDSSVYSDGNSTDNQLLFNHLFDPLLGDRYTSALDNQLAKLNGYLFLVDPTANDVAGTIDTSDDLANILENTDTSLTTEEQHFINNMLLDMKQFDDVSALSSLFSEGDRVYETLQLNSDLSNPSLYELFTDAFTTDYFNNAFTTFSDYIDVGHEGYDNLISTPFGGITYYEGREFIDSVWNQTSGFGVQEMLIILEENNTEGELAGLYDQITIALGLNSIDAKAHLLSDDPQTYKAYIENLEAYTPIDTLRDFFDTESLTDAYMGLFIDHMQTQYRILVDDPAATSQVIADLHTAISKDNIPFDQLYHEALDFSMGLLGQYYYIADSVEDSTSNETGQLSTTLMTYQYLVNLLNNADANTTELFIKTLPADVISNIESHFSAGIISDYHSDSLNDLASYIDSDSSMESAIIGLFQEAGFIDPSLDQSAALDLTFGDITDSDMQTFLQNILAQNSGELIGSFLGEITNTNISETGRFNTDNDYYQILTDLFPSLNVDDLVYQLQAFDFDDFNEIDGLYNSDGTSAADVQKLSTSQLQLVIDHYISEQFTQIDENNIPLSSILFSNIIDTVVLTVYESAINNQLNKIGTYLFEADPLNSSVLTKIDTEQKLASQLELNSNTATYENQLYIKLLNESALSDLSTNFTADFNPYMFSIFYNYIDSNNGLYGFDNNSAVVFGGITHWEGQQIINNMWASDGGIQDVLIILEEHNNNSSSALYGLFDQINQELSINNSTDLIHHLHNDDQAHFISYLTSLDSNHTKLATLDQVFSTEEKTDGFIQVFLDNLQHQYQIL